MRSKFIARASGAYALLSSPRSKAAKDAGELSDTAKAMVRQTWLYDTFGIYEPFSSKYTKKGTLQEDESINLLSEVDGYFYTKNQERKTNEFITGECDILVEGEKIIDIKSSWSANTFMEAKLTKQYETQLQCYMWLWNVPRAELAYCLVDCLPEQIEKEIKYSELPEEQVLKNMTFERIPKEQRVKKFYIERDKNFAKKMSDAVTKAQAYYDSLTLNG